MQAFELRVRDVQGRYPHRLLPFRSENIETSVQSLPDGFRIRLDDKRCPEFWMELTLQFGAQSDGGRQNC